MKPNNLQKLRFNCGLSQKGLAKAAHVSRSTIAMIENGTRDPSVKVLKRLASALNVTVDEILREPDAEPNLDN